MNYQEILNTAQALELSDNKEEAYQSYDQLYETIVRAAGDYAKEQPGALHTVGGKVVMTEAFFVAANDFMKQESALPQALYALARLDLANEQNKKAELYAKRALELTRDANLREQLNSLLIKINA
jgi:hypothetical protein